MSVDQRLRERVARIGADVETDPDAAIEAVLSRGRRKRRRARIQTVIASAVVVTAIAVSFVGLTRAAPSRFERTEGKGSSWRPTCGTFEIDGGVAAHAVSPDGSGLAFKTERWAGGEASAEIVVCDARDGSVRRFPIGMSNNQWKSDSSNFGKGNPNPPGGFPYPWDYQDETVSVTNGAALVAFDSFVDSLVPTDRDGRKDVFVLDPRTGALRIIEPGRGSKDASWLLLAPDGSAIAYAEGNLSRARPETLVIRDLAGGAPSRIPGAYPIAFSSDAARLLYAREGSYFRGEHALWLLDRTTGSSREIVQDTRRFCCGTMSADGSTVGYIAGRTSYPGSDTAWGAGDGPSPSVVIDREGSPRRQFPFGGIATRVVLLSDLALSRDGGSFAIGRDSATVVPAGTDGATMDFDGIQAKPGFAGERYAVLVVDVPTDKKRAVAAPNNHEVNSIAFVDDDRALLFDQGRSPESGLFITDIAGGKVRSITHNPPWYVRLWRIPQRKSSAVVIGLLCMLLALIALTRLLRNPARGDGIKFCTAVIVVVGFGCGWLGLAEIRASGGDAFFISPGRASTVFALSALLPLLAHPRPLHSLVPTPLRRHADQAPSTKPDPG